MLETMLPQVYTYARAIRCQASGRCVQAVQVITPVSLDVHSVQSTTPLCPPSQSVHRYTHG